MSIYNTSFLIFFYFFWRGLNSLSSFYKYPWTPKNMGPRPFLISLFQDVFGSRVLRDLESGLLWAYARSFFNVKKKTQIKPCSRFSKFSLRSITRSFLKRTRTRGRPSAPGSILTNRLWSQHEFLSSVFTIFVGLCSNRLRQKKNYLPFDHELQLF